LRNAQLKLCRVRRYRLARYPSRHPASRARQAGSTCKRVLRAAAGPVTALGLGAGSGACAGGINLIGDEDATGDAADADTAPGDVTAGDADLCTDYTLTSPVAVGDCYVQYLLEAEGRAAIAAVVEEETATPTDPCERPTLHERLLTDQPFPGDSPATNDNIDLLAPAIDVELDPPCPGGYRPAVGLEFMTAEAGDDEDVSGNPAGLTDEEEEAYGALRERREAALTPLHATDYPYRVVEFVDGRTDDSDRARAEELLRAAVRTFLDELRRDGMI
jgi:hypothetical protein